VSWVGWVLVASLFVTQVAVALVAARMLWANSAFAISVRSAVTRLLVDKMCVLASTSKVAAHVLNVRSNDLQRIFMMFMFTPILAGGVSGLLGVCVALLARFDVAGLPPAGVLLLSFLANQLLSRLASRFSARVLPLTDQRVKLMSHIVRAIAVVKLFAWEELLGQRVASVRRQELEQRQKAATVAAVLEAVALSTILIASLLFLVTWSLLGRPFVASDVFTGVSLVIIGRIPLIQVQLFAQYTGEARSSFGRIAGVLLLPSLAPSAVQVLSSFFSSFVSHLYKVDRVAEGATAGVVARDAVLRPGGEDEFSLSNLSFSCGAGEVVCVVGQVGSGKSTLLLGVIQALPAVAGAIKTTGNCA
jgi:ABC-type multidrug transport system fused ATPase/permease subunit